VKSILKRTPEEELDAQIQDIEFKIFIMCVSMVRYITDYIKHLEIGILHHLLIECNIFSVLVPLIEERPWLKTTEKGEREVFEDGKWALVPRNEYGKLPKTEAQVWIAIFNLYMSPECNQKYEVND
jgi:zinc finger MYND domain-containing protein 10